MKGPDHFASDDPEQFKKYVQLIRNNEKILEILKKKKKRKWKCLRHQGKIYFK